MMTADNQTYRKTESDMGEMRTIRDGDPVSDHAIPVRHMQTIPSEWMDEIPAPDHPPLPGRGRRGGHPTGNRLQRGGGRQIRGC